MSKALGPEEAPVFSDPQSDRERGESGDAGRMTSCRDLQPR